MATSLIAMKSLGAAGSVGGDSTKTKVMTQAEGRLADLAAMNKGIKKKTPDEEKAEKSKQDSLAKANDPTWRKAVNDADMDILPSKKKN
jgi:hypothetical protein